MMKTPLTILCLSLIAVESSTLPALTAETKPVSQKIITCDIFIAGGGLSGTATAYEGLLAGKQVCMCQH
jgi:hypothetical protein